MCDGRTPSRRAALSGRAPLLHGLLTPQRAGHRHGDQAHAGTITTAAPNVLWGTDATRFYTAQEGWCWWFGAIDHASADIVGWHVAKIQRKHRAAVSPGTHRHVGGRQPLDLPCPAHDVPPDRWGQRVHHRARLRLGTRPQAAVDRQRYGARHERTVRVSTGDLATSRLAPRAAEGSSPGRSPPARMLSQSRVQENPWAHAPSKFQPLHVTHVTWRCAITSRWSLAYVMRVTSWHA